MRDIVESTFYRYQHVTGPSCILVSIKFGKSPSESIKVIKLLSENEVDGEIQFDLEKHKLEIECGVNRANKEFNGNLFIEAIEVVPSDFPHEKQAEYAAYKIACHVIENCT